MAIINQAFVEGAQAVARAVELHARQSIESTISSTLSSTATSISATGTSITTSVPPPTDTLAPSSTSSAAGGGGGGGGGSGTSSPLLFFVALGFGVVFTNLWIIVGVKYCFRYNARNRQLRGAVDENGEPINLDNMPARPHRRRREKKLMTMDEVNDKFPMMKYKSWVADRAKEGLPTAGGVSTPPSRANSVRSVEGIVPELPSKEQQSTVGERPDTGAATHPVDKPKAEAPADSQTSTSTSGSAGVETGAALTQTRTVGSVATKDLDHNHASDDEDDDDHINAAIPPELLTTAGDTCAICIDTLEDDDDVRGLTCGHAFHAVCLDPWLTNRRACCPLCKADYYTPKPRPPPGEGTDPLNPNGTGAADPARNNGRLNLPLAPQRTFGGWGLRSRSRVPTGSQQAGTQPSNDGPASRPSRSRSRRDQQGTSPTAPQEQGAFARFRSRFPPFRVAQATGGHQSGTTAESGVAADAATPSQLEAGTRPPMRTAIN